MKILATDLDRTLLPNGSWPPDPGAIDQFNELTERHEVLVVYVTGRNLRLTEDAIREYGIRHPHVLIGDVGTSRRSPANTIAGSGPRFTTVIAPPSERMEDLFKNATRNGEIDKDTLKKMAESLEAMEELGKEDLPGVEQKLGEASDPRNTEEKSDDAS